MSTKPSSSIKYNLDRNKVAKAMKNVGVTHESNLQPNSKNGPAKAIADQIGMNGDDRNVRRGVDRYIKREKVIPK